MSKIIGLCGLPGAGKTTIAETFSEKNLGLDTPPEDDTGMDILDFIVSVIRPGMPPGDALLHDRINELLQDTIDPCYQEIVTTNRYSGSGSCRFYVNAYNLDSPPEYIEQIFSFAVKQITCALFGFTWEVVCGATPAFREMRETMESGIRYSHIPVITARQALQYIGTDVFRNAFDPNIWLNITLGRVSAMPKTITAVFISDVRFLNEAKAIVAAGGKILQIYRKPEDLQLTDDVRGQHSSNWSFLEFPENLICHRIHNKGTVRELTNNVKNVINNI